MYKFIIKDISGAVLYTSVGDYYTVSNAQQVGKVSRDGFIHQGRFNITKSSIVDVEVIDNESVDVSLFNQSVIAHTKSHFNC